MIEHTSAMSLKAAVMVAFFVLYNYLRCKADDLLCDT